MSEDDLLQMYAGYLSQRGYRAYRIPEGKDETPDLIIDKGHTILLNEFKAPELIANEETAPFVYKFKTTLSKLRRNIAKSASQLETYDPEHAFMWVVTFASLHSQLHSRSLINAIAGRIVNNDGSVLTDFTSTPAFKNTEKRIRQPDLFIWLQVNSSGQIFQVSTLLNSGSLRHDVAKSVADDLSRIRVSGFDNGPDIIHL